VEALCNGAVLLFAYANHANYAWLTCDQIMMMMMMMMIIMMMKLTADSSKPDATYRTDCCNKLLSIFI